MESKLNYINIFDFDGTLTTDTWPKIWVWIKKFGYNGEKRNNKLENALAQYRNNHVGSDYDTFFGFFNDLLVTNNETLTYDELMEGEKYIVYNPGVENFVMNSKVNNYIVSSGLKNFLIGLKIAKYFLGIYGSSVKYNDNNLINGIGKVMNDEDKILAIKDILRKNNRDENDCRNVYYIGDGYSDASAMKYVHDNGGKAIFVYQSIQNDKLDEFNNNVYRLLNKDGIIDYKCIADYNVGSELYNILNRKNF